MTLIKQYSLFTARFALLPVISGPFVVSTTSRASAIEWAHIITGFATLYLILFLLLLSAKHPEVRLSAIVALLLGLLEAVPGVPELHAAISPVLFATLAWSVVTLPAAEETARGKSRRILLLPALVLLPIFFGVGYRHQTSGVVSHLAAAIPVGGLLLIFCMVLNERHPSRLKLRNACNITMATVLFQFVFGIGALITGMLDLDSGLLLSIVRTAHITGAAAVLASTAMLAIEYRRSLPFTPE